MLKAIFNRSVLTLLAIAGILAGSPVFAAPISTELLSPTFKTFGTTDGALTTFLQVKELLTIVNERLRQSEAAFLDVPLIEARAAYEKAETSIQQAETDIRVQDWPGANTSLSTAVSALRDAQLLLMPSRTVEARTLYLDAGSIPKSRAEIAALFDQLKQANFNMLIPEVSRRGYTIYPSNYTEIDPEFKGVNFDILQVMSDEAQARQIEIHPWIWAFRVRSPDFGNPILARFPNLAAIGQKVPAEDALFLSPASADARAYLSALGREIVSRYAVNGLMLDYIRYDEAIGDDRLSLDLFRNEYERRTGKVPPEVIDQKSEFFVEWQLWRENQVNQAVQTLDQTLREVNQRLNLSASTVRSEVYGRLVKMQDWRHWANNRWIRFNAPMLYTSNMNDLETWLNWETDNGRRHDLTYPALGPLRFKHPDDIFGQIGQIRNRYLPGIAVFSLTHLKTDLKDLHLGPFRRPAITPNQGLARAIAKGLMDTAAWIEGFETRAGLPMHELSGWRNQLRAIASRLPSEDRLFQDRIALYDQLKLVDQQVTQAGAEARLSPPLTEEISRRLNETLFLVQVAQKDLRSQNAYTKPTLPPLAASDEAKQIPQLALPPADEKPVVDGSLDELIWDRAPEISQLYWHNGIARPEAQTGARLTYDSENLYVGFINYEPSLGKVRADAKKRDDLKLFLNDDAVHLFLTPGRSTKQYFQFTVNSQNLQGDSKNRDRAWDVSWQSAVRKQGDRWVVEMAIPFAAIGAHPPGYGEQWRLNICRDRYQELNPNSCWSATLGDYRTPERFGFVSFGPSALSAQP